MPFLQKFYTIDLARDNDRGPLVMEQVLSVLHSYNDRISFEIWSTRGKIQFALWSAGGEAVVDLLEAHYPGIVIREKRDFVEQLGERGVFTTHLALGSPPIFPIRRYAHTADAVKRDWIDTYMAILSALREGGEAVRGIQIVIRPVASKRWRKKGKDTLVIQQRLSSFLLFKRCWGLRDAFFHAVYHYWPLRMLLLMCLPKREVVYRGEDRIDHRDHSRESLVEAAQAKLAQMGFATTIRLVYSGNAERADEVLENIAGGFYQFNTTPEFNDFCRQRIVRNCRWSLRAVRSRRFCHDMLLSIEELAGILSLPTRDVVLPEISWAGCRVAELPGWCEVGDGVAIGLDSRNRPLRLSSQELRGHIGIWGRTGFGKSSVILQLAREMIARGEGLAVFDPHGDLIASLLAVVPPARVEKTIWFDPLDVEFPLAFNILQTGGPKDQVIASTVDAFRKVFLDSWGPRTDYILTNAVALLCSHPTGSLLGIPRVMNDAAYRRECLRFNDNPLVKQFWTEEYQKMPARIRSESSSPILNKVNRFLIVPAIRNIVGQSENRLPLREIMDNSHILLVHLAKGILGETTAALLGNFLLSHLQIAGFSRADIAPEQRRQFTVFVDELQHFAAVSTDHFRVLLAEGRKYGMNLVFASQHISQLGELADSVFSNVNSLLSFNVSDNDAHKLSRYLVAIQPEDLLHLPPYHGYLRVIRGNRPQIVSFKTVLAERECNSCQDAIRAYTRSQYARPRQNVEDEVRQFFRSNLPFS